MRLVLIILAVLFTTLLSAQTKNEVDSRLLENHGDEIYSIYERQLDYYNFLVWELNHGFEIKKKSEIEGDLLPINNIISSKGEAFKIENILTSNLKIFNFLDYNFIRKKNELVYYDLGDNKILVIKSITQVWNEFKNK